MKGNSETGAGRLLYFKTVLSFQLTNQVIEDLIIFANLFLTFTSGRCCVTTDGRKYQNESSSCRDLICMPKFLLP